MNRWAMLFAAAARRHGVLTVDDARACGISDRTLRARAAAEGWERLHRGVWAVPGAPGGPLRECAAALAAAGSQALLARRTAGWLWDLRAPAVRPELLLPGEAAPVRRPGLVVIRSMSLAPEDLGVHAGLRVTTPARTLADLAAVCSQDRLLEMVVRARQRELVETPDLAAQVATMRRAPGIHRLRAAVELLDGERVDSLLERDVRRGIRASGLPAPAGAPLWLGSGPGRVQIDIAWPERRVGVEVDGFAYHRTADDLARDHRKANVAAAAGWVLLRVGYLRWRRDRAGFLGELTAVLSPSITSGR